MPDNLRPHRPTATFVVVVVLVLFAVYHFGVVRRTRR